MSCDRCGAENPEPAGFCWRCGRVLDHVDDRGDRRGAYAIQPSEHVAQLALTSTLLPHGNRNVANEYRWSLLAGAALALLLAAVGLLAPAVMIAAFLLPTTYLVFAYDVDLWEDRPGLTLASAFALSGVGAVVVSLVFFSWLGEDAFAGILFAGADPERGRLAAVPIGSLLFFGVALPVVSEIVRQAGPVALARQPRFDDMIDGFTLAWSPAQRTPRSRR